jgi:hypothetical protein
VLVAISIGGRTRLVIEAARKFKNRGGTVAVITGDPGSPLAAIADHVAVVLHAGLAEGVGAGRHLLTLVALSALLKGPKPATPPPPHSCPSRLHGVVFVGYCETESSALFAALKVFEVYGAPASWWSLEQLVHAPILGLPSNRLLILQALGGSERVEEVSRVLGEVGFSVEVVRPWGTNRLDNALHATRWVIECLASSQDLPGKPKYLEHPHLSRLTRLIYIEEPKPAPVDYEAPKTTNVLKNTKGARSDAIR